MTIEIWKDIVGYEGYYQVSNLGNVRSLDRIVKNKGNYFGRLKGKPISQTISNWGYNRIRISKDKVKKTLRVHKCVVLAFPEVCGNFFEGCDIDHINGIKTDNRAENLRVCTRKENVNNPNTKWKICGRFGMKNPTAKKIYQYDLDGNFINEYEGSGDLFRKLGIKTSVILDYFSRNKKTCHGFVFRREKV